MLLLSSVHIDRINVVHNLKHIIRVQIYLKGTTVGVFHWQLKKAQSFPSPSISYKTSLTLSPISFIAKSQNLYERLAMGMSFSFAIRLNAPNVMHNIWVVVSIHNKG